MAQQVALLDFRPGRAFRIVTQYAYSYTRSDQKYMIGNESILWCVPKRVQLRMAYLL